MFDFIKNVNSSQIHEVYEYSQKCFRLSLVSDPHIEYKTKRELLAYEKKKDLTFQLDYPQL